MKISIITVCFNAVGVIEKTILSVISQTYNDVEYIMVSSINSIYPLVSDSRTL